MPKQSSIGEMLEEGRRDEITSMDNPDCIKCNECCSMGSMLTDEEYLRLKRFLKKDKRGKMLFNQGIELILSHLKNGVIYWICPFSINYRCKIYNTRPNICRMFHCDEPELSKMHRNTYDIKSHTIGDLFHIQEIVRQIKQGKL